MIKINNLKRYFLNGLLLSCVALIMRTVSVSFNIYVSSKIGAEAMGLLTLTGGIYGFAITVATSGINMAVVRLVSSALPDNSTYLDKKSDTCVRKIMKNALCYCLIFSLSASIILFVSAKNIGRYLLDDIRTVPSLKLMSLSLVPISISSAINGYFYAVRRVYKNVISQLFEQAIKISVVSFLLFVIAPYGLTYACIAVVAGGALSEGASVIISASLYFFDRITHRKKSQINIGRVSDFGSFKISNSPMINTRVIPIALPVAVSAYVRSLLITVEHLAIPWGLKRHGADSEAALSSYGILHGMVIPILLFPSAVLNSFSSLLVPELSSAYAKGDKKKIKRIVSRVFSLTLFFSIGVSGALICYSNEIGYFIYGSNEASLYIRLLAPLIPLMYLDGAVDSMLKGLNEHLYTMRVNITDSLLSVILIVILLPLFGIKGYVAVIFITELINTSFSILKLLNLTKIKTPIFKWIIIPVLLISLSTVVTRLLFNTKFFSEISGKAFTFFEISITALAYILLSALIKRKSTK